ncbi:cyclohexanone monooxygenase [Thozetella sp. PMI_491]|nr:cyclohexanone monooxygenase [Thozetella sp. PMI_491]
MTNKTTDYDAIVVGTGFSGVRTLWELAQLGLSMKCFEAGSDVGGAWYWNRYPGARTDSEAWVYAMNFVPGLKEAWNYSERYPSQGEVQQYLGRVVDRFDLRKHIEFDTRIAAASYSEDENRWTITTASGVSTTCRYFLAATGPLSIAKKPPFAGLDKYTGEWYQASSWPEQKIDFHGKRVAVIGTGATGVQIIPKLAPVARELTVFQRTPNYVLPGRNYIIDEHQAGDIKRNYEGTLTRASKHPFGLAMTPTGNTVKDVADPDKTRRILDAGWECGGFHFQFETLDDLFTNQQSNDVASEYVRQKIRAIVQDPTKAELLCPKYPFLSKRPPCGHFYYEAYNRPNVNLVDISKDNIEIYENGIRTSSGAEYECDMIIFALGYDAATGALSEMDVRGKQGKSLKDFWAAKLDTFAGVLVPGFPNMFVVCGPHVPFGNMPVVLDIEVDWIGKTIRHLEENKIETIEVTQQAVRRWSAHLDDAFKATLFAESARDSKAWFVGANIPGKAISPLFYFGGVPTWADWLESETKTGWASMELFPPRVTEAVDENSVINSQRVADVTAVA